MVLPTDTVYGLAALARNDEALRAVFAAKNRDTAKPLSVAVWSPAMFLAITTPTPIAKTMAEVFWPGDLTLVCAHNPASRLSPLCTSGSANIGVRYPHTDWTQIFADNGFFEPIVLTSANISTRPAPRTAHAAQAQIGAQVDLIIDGGATQTGVASTVIDTTRDPALVLRPGSLPPTDLAAYSLQLPGEPHA